MCLSGAMTQQQAQNYTKFKRRTIKMLVLVWFVFAVCWLPLNLYHISIDFGTNPYRFSLTTFQVCHWIAMSSVCYNPFIYFWHNENFRQVIVKKSKFESNYDYYFWSRFSVWKVLSRTQLALFYLKLNLLRKTQLKSGFIAEKALELAI